MNNYDLNKLSNDLLTAFFDDAEATDLIKIAEKYGIPLTGKIFQRATKRAIEWLESPNTDMFCELSKENKNRIFTNGLQGISDKFGAVLGKDFSVVDDGVLIQPELLEKMMADLPPKARAEFEEKGYIKTIVSDPFKMLEDSLGVPFFTSLEAVVILRAKMLSDPQCADYMSFIAGGLQGKHNWIPNTWVLGFFLRVLGEQRYQSIMSLDLPDNDNGETCALGLEDLLTALGSIEISHDPIHGRLMGRDQMLLLDKVFRCPNFSFADAAEQLRRLEKN